MKKTYINPTIEVINIETQQMLAASKMGFGDATDTMDSREFDFPIWLLDVQNISAESGEWAARLRSPLCFISDYLNLY